MFTRFDMKRIALWLTITMFIAFGVAGTIFAAGKSGIPLSWTGDNNTNLSTSSNKADGSKSIGDSNSNSSTSSDNSDSSRIDQSTSNKADGLIGIDLSSVSSEVNIIPSDGQEVKAHLYGTASNYPKLTAEISGNRLHIKTEYPVSIGVHLKPENLTLDIEIPKSYSGELNGESVSGAVNVNDFKFENMTLKTTSGAIKAKNITSRGSTVTTTSGKVELQSLKGGLSFKSTSGSLNAVLADNSDKVEITTTSGKTNISGVGGDFSFSSVSGALDAEFAKVNGNVKLHSTSGELRVKAPEDSDFDVSYKSTSGSFRSSLPLTTTTKDKHRVDGKYGKGGHQIQADTVSASLELAKK